MGYFSFEPIYVEDGNKVLEIDILPEKYCNFDCVFCPLGRTINKLERQQLFAEIDHSLSRLVNIIKDNQVDLVYINSKGEALLNSSISYIIDFIKSKGVLVRLLSNGYLLGRDTYKEIANHCDEVVGELTVITENDFQKILRPLDSYTLTEYLSNMASFNKQYSGVFTLAITILKGYNDDEQSIQQIKNLIDQIAPDKLVVTRIENPRLKRLIVDEQRFNQISTALMERNILN